MAESLAGKRVLVVEDDASIREILCEYLNMAGMHVDAASNARKALDLYTNDYDLITLDFKMPGMDGSKLHYVISKGFGYGKRVSEIIPQRLPPILIVTGCASDPAVHKLLDAEHVIDILEKPVSRQALMDAVTGILERSAARKSHREKLAIRLGKSIVRRDTSRMKQA